MPIPTSESEIRTALKLDEHGALHPAPPLYSRYEHLIEFEGVPFTRAAIDAAFKAADDETVRNILKYPEDILAHNNLPSHGGAGAKLNIRHILDRFTSEQTRERIAQLLQE